MEDLGIDDVILNVDFPNIVGIVVIREINVRKIDLDPSNFRSFYFDKIAKSH